MSYSIIKGYAANTNIGLVRTKNEDRVTVIVNMQKPASFPNNMVWPHCSFFAIYDGHGGITAANYLRDKLH